MYRVKLGEFCQYAPEEYSDPVWHEEGIIPADVISKAGYWDAASKYDWYEGEIEEKVFSSEAEARREAVRAYLGPDVHGVGVRFDVIED